ncbi:MAG: hypothetical protein KatS3mg124_1089 [Porticoccaceae bacterium]|nr:MAG: hypothetical protein KatS3mg124_1089 [Porticoccaceae bacterium]
MAADPVELRPLLEEEGFAVVPGALQPDELEAVRAAFDRALEATRASLGTTHIATLDPNPASIRLVNLPALDPIFLSLLLREDALAAVRALLGEHFAISNFTAHDALPGAAPMRLHSDQALVVPPPWIHPWAINVIWCLDDIDEENGATRYVPGSHHWQTFAEVPPDAEERLVSFRAPAGSFVAMEGRLWHTSGHNRSRDRRRRLLFAYYTADFIRPQVNWALCLPREIQAALDPRGRELFGLSPRGNTRIGSTLTRLAESAISRGAEP